eukprot:3034102-Prorocentrum_lima.AAC.1
MGQGRAVGENGLADGRDTGGGGAAGGGGRVRGMDVGQVWRKSNVIPFKGYRVRDSWITMLVQG